VLLAFAQFAAQLQAAQLQLLYLLLQEDHLEHGIVGGPSGVGGHHPGDAARLGGDLSRKGRYSGKLLETADVLEGRYTSNFAEFQLVPQTLYFLLLLLVGHFKTLVFLLQEMDELVLLVMRGQSLADALYKHFFRGLVAFCFVLFFALRAGAGGFAVSADFVYHSKL
jgi:hypothetical protein